MFREVMYSVAQLPEGQCQGLGASLGEAGTDDLHLLASILAGPGQYSGWSWPVFWLVLAGHYTCRCTDWQMCTGNSKLTDCTQCTVGVQQTYTL